jgi:hypothetical protein
MYSTREVLLILKEANPDGCVTEDRIRRVIRRGEVASPKLFAGRFVWTQNRVLQLARSLGLKAPALTCRVELESGR